MAQRGRESVGINTGWSDGGSDDSSSSSSSNGSSSSSSPPSSDTDDEQHVATEQDLVRNNDRTLHNDRFSDFRRRVKGKLNKTTTRPTPEQQGKGKTTTTTSRQRRAAAWERLAQRQIMALHRLVSEKCPILLNQTCNAVLLVALFFWLIIVLTSSPSSESGSLPKDGRLRHHGNGGIVRKGGGETVPPHQGILKEAVYGIKDMYVDGLNRMVGAGKKTKKKEEDLPGCIRPDWHFESFPNCNDVHGVNIKTVVLRGIKDKKNKPSQQNKLGYLSSGLWRSVFAVTARNENELSVLKAMKEKHAVDKRNFDRHRRDAVVMERLSGSPNVVDIFGFCGNTVLTEYIPSPLDDVIFASHGEPTHPFVNTPQRRLDLAIGVMKGLAALHEVDGGPIVHADVQAGQFLVSSTGDIKVNDFNRCRFMAHYKASGTPCKFAIPTSPGKCRSPEEYMEDYLDEKVDVYSGANILYGIITGQKAWHQFSTTDTKRYVKEGAIPYIPDDLRQASPLDGVLANVTELAYEVDPAKRISAREAVNEMERVRAKFQN